VGELRPHFPGLAAAGVRLVFIGSGSPEQARDFATEHRLLPPDHRVVTSPDLAAYRAAGLHRGLFATIGPAALFQAGRALARGYVQIGIHGDRTQQGGAVVLDARCEVVLHHANRSLGGHVRPAMLLEAVRRGAASGGRAG
jgi:hypothetical protein